MFLKKKKISKETQRLRDQRWCFSRTGFKEKLRIIDRLKVALTTAVKIELNLNFDGVLSIYLPPIFVEAAQVMLRKL